MKRTRILLAAAALLLAAPTLCRAQRVVSYNTGAFTKWGGTSYELVAGILSDLEPDFVALQEVDSCTARTSKVNQAGQVCRALNGLPCTDPADPWKWAYGASMPYKGGKYGNAVLYRGEALDIFNIAIPKGSGKEPRCCLVVETEKAVFASVHLDYGSSEAALAGARLITSKMLKSYRKSSKPVIVCGDFNMRPDTPTIKYMEKKWKLVSVSCEMSFPCSKEKKADRCIDYVWVLKNKAPIGETSAEVIYDIPWRSVRNASDHYPLAAEIK